ncbi:MAG: DUF1080 domain-containing protein [Verrucomicrobia bacterium]|nr:DUF1080 domain-containing protein [Verrucomicrobiota bacterium]
MKFALWLLGLFALALRLHAAPVPLFDGRSLAGWEGETNAVWRVREGVIVGGSMAGNPRNEFLATTQRYKNFHLRLEYRLVGTEGFINGGVQFRSKRIAQPPNEMSGFQADIGAGFSGCVYDESRRNRMLVMADTNLVASLERPGEWNRYEIIATGPQATLVLNGQRTATWVERDPAIETEGVIALQIHGDCKAEISFRNITLEVLPDSIIPPEAEILGRIGHGQPALPTPEFPGGIFELGTNEVVVLVGQENFVREQKSGALETLLASGFASQAPRVRSMAWEADTVYEQWRDLNFGSWLRQLEAAGATVILAQFGQMEALDGVGRLPEFVAAYHRLLDQFAGRTRKVVLVSPMPFEKPLASHAPDLTLRNGDVAAYTSAIRDLARRRGALFVDLFRPILERPLGSVRLTEDGLHAHEAGLEEVARVMASQLGIRPQAAALLSPLREAILEKNRLWFDSWRPANWSFVYGDRVATSFAKAGGGEPSLKEALERHRPLLATADARIHALARGEAVEGRLTPPRAASPEPSKGLTPEEQLAKFELADGYQINLFASEREGVVKPTQCSWDERGRLYVACSPTYPQSQASATPADYILVLEDSDGDGRADKSWRFAEGLTMVQGVEPGDGGVFVCDFDQIAHYRDTNGDGKADVRRVVMSGFGIGDTHQLVNSISHGPDGSLWFTQGLHAFSRVETPWGIARLDRSAVWRWRPRTLRLDGFFGGGMAGANCWGVAFDDFGQVFHKSGDRPHGYWTVPGMVRGGSPIGSGSTLSADVSYAKSPEQYHSVGPLFDTSPKTTSLDWIGTRALPDDIQGCAVIGGYFGAVVELHRLSDAGAGFKSAQLPKLVRSSTPDFRPVDVSVGPDGAIYVADWYNPTIGHYQASYADPRRDKTRGRIWRVTAKGRAGVKQPDLASMPAAALLKQLDSSERWTRYQAKRLLFYRPAAEVLREVDAWVDRLSDLNPASERLLLEVTGVLEAHEAPRAKVLQKLMRARDARVRAYGARVAGGWGEALAEARTSLLSAARDEHPRVRLEAAVASTYLPGPDAVEVVAAAWEGGRDPFLDYALRLSARTLQPRWAPLLAQGGLSLSKTGEEALRALISKPYVPPSEGGQLYDMACLPCHQPEGKGLPGVYPPLAGSEWVKGDAARLIKVVLHGLTGPLTVAGQSYGGPNSVPMPGMAGMTDAQIAEVLSFVRSRFGEGASPVKAEQVRAIREAHMGRERPWAASELE